MKKSIKLFLGIIIGCIFLYGLYKTDVLDKSLGSVNYSSDLEVYILDTGNADSILVRLNDKNVLIDAGNNNDGEKLVNYFKSLNITKFDYVFGTHPHEDHIGGMDNIIENFDINKYYMPDVITNTKTFESVLDALSNKEYKYYVPLIDDEYKLDELLINVLYVGNDESNLNDTSIVLLMTYGNNKFLFMGDASKSVEKNILNKLSKIDVLKVGHHGSKYSTSKDFINIIRPEYAVITSGLNNAYNHPHQEVLDILNNNSIKIFRSDIDSTVLFISDGVDISIKTFKTDTNGD